MPMGFQDPPAALDRMVFAVGGRVVRQAHREVILLHKGDDAVHAWGPPVVILWSVIEIDHQRGAMRKACPCALPPLAQAVHQTVTWSRSR